MVKSFLIILSIAVVATSCRSYSFTEADMINKGMTASTVLSLTSMRPTADVPFSVPGHTTSDYRVIMFPQVIGSNSADFYIVFESDKVIYWGHPYEFKRHPDQTLNDIGKAAYEAVQVAKKK